MAQGRANAEGGSGGGGGSVERREGSASKRTGAGERSGYPAAVERLITELSRLPGIGRRSAERLTLHLLKATPEGALGLARAIESVKSNIRHCAVCYNLADVGVRGAGGGGGSTAFSEAGEGAANGAVRCAICQDATRERHAVLVVEEPRDVLALEGTGLWRGLYHVLLGRLAPLEGVGPGDLTIAALVERVAHPEANPGGVPVRDVVLGLNPTLESDGTGLYLTEELKKAESARSPEAGPLGVSRLARGLPAGGSLQFASKAVLADALRGRQNVSGAGAE